MVSSKKADLRYLIFFILGVVLINLISSFFYNRFDFTAEKRYTLSKNTENILSRVDEPLQVTVYLEGDFPAGFKRLQHAVKDLLQDYRSAANKYIEVDFVNPGSGSQEAQQQAYQDLVSKGLEPTNLTVDTEEGRTQKIIFPSALITYQGRQIAVNLFQTRIGSSPEEVLNNSVQNLEYAFSSAIKKIISGGKPRIGFTEGNGELSDLQLTDAMKSLQYGYEAGRVDLNAITFEGLDKISLLVIPKPDREFTEAQKYKIDYFLMKGGRIFWVIDNVSAELDSLRKEGSQLAFAKKLNLDDMLFKYGIRINYDLVADMNCAQIPLNVGNVGGQSQIQLVPWLFYPVFIPTSSHPLVKNLDGIRSEFANSLDTIAVPNVKQEIILTSSPFSRLLKIPSVISLQMVEEEPNPEAFRSNPKPVGILLEGRFPSVFVNRPLPPGIPANKVSGAKSVSTKMIVVADGDILKNQISSKDGSTFPLGFDRYTEQQFGNRNFLLNVADYLTDDSGIIELRNKEIKIRLLDKARIRSEKVFWQMLNILVPIVLILIFAFSYHFYRKRRFGRQA